MLSQTRPYESLTLQRRENIPGVPGPQHAAALVLVLFEGKMMA